MARLSIAALFLLALFFVCPSVNLYAQISDTPSAEVAVPDAAEPTAAEQPVDTSAIGQNPEMSSLLLSGGEENVIASTISIPMPNNLQFTGAAVTKIPIIVPPGRKGLAPKIELNYHSSRANSWLGVGWNMELGSIQRATKKGVNYSGTDFIFITNGSASELVPRTNEWGAGYYGAKIEGDFTKFYFTGSSWIVMTKDGTVYNFGTTIDSRQDNFRWCLDTVKDTNGNYMQITYFKHEGEIYPSAIYYTAHISGLQSHTNLVTFYYESRGDVFTSYVSGYPVSTTYRMKTIDISASNTRVRTYKLTYSGSGNTGRSMLSSIQQFGDDAEVDSYGTITNEATASKLPEITFTQNTIADGWDGAIRVGPTLGTAEASKYCLTGDLNSDNKTDMWCYLGGNTWHVQFATGSGWFGEMWSSPTLLSSAASSHCLSGDLNADGTADMWCYHGGTTWREEQTTGSGWSGAWRTGPSLPSTNASSHCLPGDYNGDGRTDMRCYMGGNTWYEAISIGGGWEGAWRTGPTLSNTIASNHCMTGDLNGDGRTDMWCHISGSLWYEAISNGSGWDGAYRTGPEITNFPAAGRCLRGDLNGDGRTDMWCYLGGNTWHESIANGNGWTGQYILGPALGTSLANTQCKAGELNGDGRADMWCYLGGNTWHESLSMSNGWMGSMRAGPTLGSSEASKYCLTGDLNAEGKTDMWCYLGGNTWHEEIASGDIPDLLEVINNGYGSTTTFAYTPSSAYSNHLMPYVIQTVSSITVNDGLGNIAQTNYTYHGGQHDFAEREFSGFETITQTNPSGTKVETSYHQDKFRKGRQYQVELKNPSGGLLGKTAFNWSYPDGNPSWAFIKLNRKRTEDYDTVTVFSQEDYIYDDLNGYLTSLTSSGTGAENIKTETEYQNRGTWVWRPTKITVTDSLSNKVRETETIYQSSTGNLLKKTFWLLGGTSLTIEIPENDGYEYGNPKTIKDANGNSTSIEYDASTHTYPTKITYPTTGGVSHIIEMAYNNGFGITTLVKDENDGNDEGTEFTLDPFGRITTIDYPDGGQIITEYHDNATPKYIVTKVKENAGSTSDKYEYFDGLGRSIQTLTFGESGTSVVSKTHYDTMGRIDLTEGPFFSTGVGYPKTPPSEYPWVQTFYDYKDRPSQVTSPDATYSTISTNYSYSGFSVTVTDPDGKQRKITKDYLGRVKEVKEYGDNSAEYTTTYSYNAAGDLLNVTDHLGNATILTYDTLGRKKTMQNPDMGYWQYTSYDANGNLLTQKDAKDQTITFTYDELNRIKTKTYSTSDPTVTYTYDNLTIPYGKGRLYSVSTSNATTTIDGYDKMGRAKSVSETITGAGPYTTLYDYDLAGKTTKITYPDNYYVTYAYYAGTGLLHTATGSDNVVYATNTLYEPSGNIGQINHHNQTASRYSYDNWSTRLTGISTTYQSTVLQGKTYNSYPSGDIYRVIDHLPTYITYTHTYDNLHRLGTETNTGGYPANSYTYNATGNIESKTVGSTTLTYAYNDTGHKHAVSSITLNSTQYNYAYDANGNMTGGWDFTDLGNIVARSITYNTDNMPVEITRGGSTTYITYDGLGQRVKKSGSGSTTYYIGPHYEVTNNVPSKYIFAGDMRIAKVTPSNTYYYHSDNLGSAAVMTDSSGNVAERITYKPFGEQRTHTGSIVTNYKFTDQELDPETGLYNYNARLYDMSIGRFISADTVVPEPFNPQSLNRYSYTINNPLSYIDPTGNEYIIVKSYYDDYNCCGGGGGGYGGGGNPDPWRMFSNYDSYNGGGRNYGGNYGASSATATNYGTGNQGGHSGAANSSSFIDSIKIDINKLKNVDGIIEELWQDSDALMALPFGGAVGGTIKITSKAPKIAGSLGQLHHAISTKVWNALNKLPQMVGKFKLRDPRLVTRAKDILSHRGYQTWHRELDKEVANWLARHRKTSPDEFIEWLQWRYKQPDILERFPQGLPRL